MKKEKMKLKGTYESYKKNCAANAKKVAMEADATVRRALAVFRFKLARELLNGKKAPLQERAKRMWAKKKQMMKKFAKDPVGVIRSLLRLPGLKQIVAKLKATGEKGVKAAKKVGSAVQMAAKRVAKGVTK